MFANATNLTCEWADWHDRGESLWKSATLHRDGRAKLAQEMGQKILDAMETFNRNPQPFTAGIGEWQLHGEIGIYHLNRNPDMGKFHAIDIASLVERQRVEHIAMLQAMDALQVHNEVARPPFPPSAPCPGQLPGLGSTNREKEPPPGH